MITIRASQHRTISVPIRVILIEVSPFLLLPTFRALARGPETLRGGVEGSQHFGDGSQWPQRRTPDSDQPTSRFVGYVLSQEIDALKQNHVENFGAPEAIISMHVGTKNGIQRGAEKAELNIIPNGERYLLLSKSQEKADSSGKPRPRNDKLSGSSAAC